MKILHIIIGHQLISRILNEDMRRTANVPGIVRWRRQRRMEPTRNQNATKTILRITRDGKSLSIKKTAQVIDVDNLR